MENIIGKNCIMEKRPKKYKFGTKNYGEIPGWINKADGDPWDVFVPGYGYDLKINKNYKIKSVIGVFELKDGNHKIAVKLYVPGYCEMNAYRDIATYCQRYSNYTGISGKFVKLVD